MQFAPGIKEALEVAQTFADDEEAAQFWSKGMPLTKIEDVAFPGADGQDQKARLYRGSGGPVVYYIHGGGWVGGSIELNDRACSTLAVQSGCDVVSLSYRFAPDHPYPAALNDCRAGVAHFQPQFGNDPYFLAGASAGANLALSLALDEAPAGLVLFYGVFGADFETQSYQDFAEGFGFTKERAIEIFDHYDPSGLRHTTPQLCPLNATEAQLEQLPPTFLMAAEYDVLRDDSLHLAARFQASNCPHEMHVEPGVTHGFINRGRLVPAADRCLEQTAGFLARISETIVT